MSNPTQVIGCSVLVVDFLSLFPGGCCQVCTVCRVLPGCCRAVAGFMTAPRLGPSRLKKSSLRDDAYHGFVMFRVPSARAAKFDNFMKPSTPARANGTAFTGGRAAQLRPSARALLGSWVLVALTPRCTGGASSAAEDIALFRPRGVHHGTDKVTGLHVYQTMSDTRNSQRHLATATNSTPS